MRLNVSNQKKIRIITENETRYVESNPFNIQKEIELLMKLHAINICTNTFELPKQQVPEYYFHLLNEELKIRGRKIIRIIIGTKTRYVEGTNYEVEQEIALLKELSAINIDAFTFSLSKQQASEYFSKLTNLY